MLNFSLFCLFFLIKKKWGKRIRVSSETWHVGILKLFFLSLGINSEQGKVIIREECRAVAS